MSKNKPSRLHHRALIVKKAWLSGDTFELSLQKPERYTFKPGQKIAVVIGGKTREYTPVSTVDDTELTLCIRHVQGGKVTPRLAGLNPGDYLSFSNAYGFFVHRPGRSVFVATGTGIAPYVAFVRAGARDYVLLHGVKSPDELYYRGELEQHAQAYIPCIPHAGKHEYDPTIFAGRITAYLEDKLAPDTYTFYLCGNGAMVREATLIIDRRFSAAKIFSESFTAAK